MLLHIVVYGKKAKDSREQKEPQIYFNSGHKFSL